MTSLGCASLAVRGTRYPELATTQVGVRGTWYVIQATKGGPL
jgi:hypothetical protein